MPVRNTSEYHIHGKKKNGLMRVGASIKREHAGGDRTIIATSTTQ